MKSIVAQSLNKAFGMPTRETVKVKSWTLTPSLSAVLQIDQPSGSDSAILWLPYPAEGQAILDIALMYASESGRHSGTYASPGLKKGEPALKLSITSKRELDDVVTYIEAMQSSLPLPPVVSDVSKPSSELGVQRAEGFGEPPPVKPRREAIPRLVQREVWQRDGGRCVECSSKEKLCYDHIVPFSLGGSNTIRNIQLLCEPCNLAKGNRI